MVLGSYSLSFSIDVDVPPTKVRDWTIRSVVGGGSAVGRPGTLTLLEEGPERYASRYTEGSVRQLRVIEWTRPDHGDGAVVHAVGPTPRLSARYSVDVSPSPRGSHLKVRYTVETPIVGLALSFRMSRRRALARRLASSWIHLDDERRWADLRLEPTRAPTPASGAG